MHRRFVVLLAVVTAVLVGCTGHRPGAPTPSSGALAVGTTSFSLDVSGQQRSYLVHRPAADAPASGYPLVVVLHGGLGSAALAEEAYGWDALADRDGFVVVYPNGVDRTWNAGTCCGTAARTGVDDVAFITQVVSQVSALVPVDPTRRFATGMSNGAMMTYRLACQTGLFAAIAPVSGTQLIDCSTAEPVSVLHIHGAADPNVRPDGKRGSGPAHVTGPPLARVWEGWRVRDDCGRFDVTRSAEVTSGQASCPSQRAVEWILVTDGGHEWPGGRSSTNPAGLDATALIWTFFAAHPHR